jgi:putative aldouronate transport system substrate-binding protein
MEDKIMKKACKKIFTVVLTITMLVSLVACAGNSKDTSSNSSASLTPSASSATDTAEADPQWGAYDEPVTITTAIQASAVQEFRDGDSYEDNEWTRLIKDTYNIDVDVALSADITTDAYRNKMNVLLASGDLPDVLKFDDRNWLKQAIEAGYVLDISEVFDKYASDAVKQYATDYADAFEGVTVDGKLYALPYMSNNFHQCTNLWIREDWLKNVGMSAPTTIDEMVELARAFKNGDPDGNGIDGDTYGLCLADNVVQNNYGTIMGILEAYGVPCYGDRGIFYRNNEGKITFSYIQPEAKKALEVVRNMFSEGLIDPEFMVKDTSKLETDWAQGTIGMTYHMNWGTWHPFNIVYEDKGVITRPYPIPVADGYEVKQGIQSNQVGEYFVISSKCKNPEAVMKMLNLYEKTAISGSEDDFKTYWADEQYRLSPIYIGIPTENFAPQLLEAFAAGSSDNLKGTALQYYNYVKGFEDGSLADDANAYGTWGQMFSEGSMKIDLDYQKNGQIVSNIMASQEPDIWIQNASVLSDLVKSAYTAIITGEKDLDYFDTFVQEWLNAGGQQTLDEMEKLYPQD